MKMVHQPNRLIQQLASERQKGGSHDIDFIEQEAGLHRPTECDPQWSRFMSVNSLR